MSYRLSITFFSLVLILFASSLFGQKSDEREKERATIDRFWTILEKSPRRGTAFDRVYGYYADTARLEELLERCRKATVHAPDDAQPHLLLGLVLARRGDDPGAIASFEKATSLAPNDALAPYYLAEALVSQGLLREAMQSLEQSLERKPARTDLPGVLQLFGRVCERFGDREKSAAVWTKMEETYPGDLDILTRIAETLDEEGKTTDAFSRYEKLIELAGKDDYARVRFSLAAADLQIRMGKKQEAIDRLETLLEGLAAHSWLVESIRNRIERVFTRQADYAGLVEYYKKRLAARPNDVETTRRLTIALIRLGRAAEAKELLEKTLEKAPTDLPLRLALVDLLVHEKDFDAVDAQYAKIAEIDPDNPDHITQRGLAALENRKHDEPARKANAAKVWAALIATRPDDVSRIVQLADLLADAGIDAEAEKMYEKAVALRPDDPGYREYLGFFFHKIGEKDKAIATLEQIAGGDRRSAPNLAQLSNVLRGLGYSAEALDATRAAAELAPDDFELQMRLATDLLDTGNASGALKQLEIARKLIETDEERERFVRLEIKAYQAAAQLESAIDRLLEILHEKCGGAQRETIDAISASMRERKSERESARRTRTFFPGGPSADKEADTETTNSAPLSIGPLDDAFLSDSVTKKKAATELWRLAMFLLAANANGEARDAIESASTLAPESLPVLQIAADIYVRTYDEAKAATIYERLATVDAAHRVDHLKRLAGLQRDLGQIDKAVETARLVMATGAGNAANSRFYADMLLAVGNRDGGIEALRRAVRIDPTDQATLRSLATALVEDGQTDEAIEIMWRLFERAEDLTAKMGAVARLAESYRQSRQVSELIDRLKMNSHDKTGRRETAFCLAQAYVSIEDFPAARQALEALLDDVGELDKTETRQRTPQTAASGDTFLLAQLSKIAEQQNDFDAAVRYQESVCELTGAPADGDRLLFLYISQGDREKANALFTRTILSKSEFADQLAGIDQVLANADAAPEPKKEYDKALELLDRIAGNAPDNWEILFRKMQSAYWSGDFEQARATAKRLHTLPLPRETLSAAKEREKKRQGGSDKGLSTPARPAYYNSPWKIGDGTDLNEIMYGMGSGVPNFFRDVSGIFATIFREKLILEQYYYQRGNPMGKVPAKPVFKPDTFGDAAFATLLWEMKFAIDYDSGVREITQKSTENDPGNDTKEESDNRNPVPQIGTRPPGESPFQRPKTATMLKSCDHLCAWANEARAAFPENTTDLDILARRCRLEAALLLFEAIAESPGTFELPKTFHERLQLDDAAPLQWRAVVRLALAGQKEYAQLAFTTILAEWTLPEQLKRYEGVDIEKEVRIYLDSLGDRKPMIRSGSGSLQDGGDEPYKLIVAQINKKVDDLHKIEKHKGRDTITDTQKTDWLVQIWERTATDKKERFAFPHTYYPYYSVIVKHLREAGREADIARIGTAVEAAAHALPTIYTLQAQRLRRPQKTTFSIEKMLQPTGTPWRRGVFYSDYGAPDAAAANLSDEERFERVKPLLLRAKDGMVARIKDRKTPGGVMGSGAFAAPDQTQIAAFVLDAANSVTDLLPKAEKKPENNYGYYSIGRLYIPFGTDRIFDGELDGDKLKWTITRDELGRLQRVETEIFKYLNLYFKIESELAQARESVPQPGSSRRSSRSGLLNIHTPEINFMIDGRGSLRSYNIQQFLQGSIRSLYSDQDPLGIAAKYFELMDKALRNGNQGEGVEESELASNHAQRFEDYLIAHGKSDNPNVRKIVEDYRFRKLLGNSYNDTVDATALRKFFEAEYKTAKEEKKVYPPERIALLAVLHAREKQYGKSIEYMEELPTATARDLRLRELLILRIGVASGSKSKEITDRLAEAVDRLKGFTLGDVELEALRAANVLLGRNEDATRLLERLIATSTTPEKQYRLLNDLRDAGEEMKEQAIEYATKILTTPHTLAAGARNDGWPERVREIAVEILTRYKQFDAIIKRLENERKNLPGSRQIGLQLADFYTRADRKDDAKKLAKELESIMDGAAPKELLAFAAILAKVDLKDEAATWSAKTLEADPGFLFHNFWEHVERYRRAKQLDLLVAILKRTDPALLRQHQDNIANNIGNWMNRDEEKKPAMDLFAFLWKGEGFDTADREEMRWALARSAMRSHKVLYPYAREMILDMIHEPTAKRSRTERSTDADETDVVLSTKNPIGADNLSDTWCTGFVNTLFNLMDHGTSGALQKDVRSLLKDVRQIVADHEAVEPDKRIWSRYVYAKSTEAMLELKLKNTDAALAIVRRLEAEEQAATAYDNCALILGLALEETGTPDTIKQAIICVHRGIEKGDNTKSEMLDRLFALLKSRLDLKSENPERGRPGAVAAIRKDLDLLRRCGTNSHVQIGNTYYNAYSLRERIVELVNGLLDAGFAADVRRIYYASCKGKEWYETLLADKSRFWYIRDIQTAFDRLAKQTTVADFIAAPDIFIPLYAGGEHVAEPSAKITENANAPGDSESRESVTESEEPDSGDSPVAATTLELGTYVRAPSLTSMIAPTPDTPPSVDSMLFQALKILKEKEPAKYARARKALEAFFVREPENISAAAAVAYCEILDGEDEKFARSICRLAEIVSTRPADDVSVVKKAASDKPDGPDESDSPAAIPDQAYLACWILAREIYSAPDRFKAGGIDTACEKIANFSMGYIGRSTDAHADGIDNDTYAGALAFVQEMRRFAPAAFAAKVKEMLAIRTLKGTLLVKPGVIVRNLESKYRTYIDRFGDAIDGGGAAQVLAIFEAVFSNGWPTRTRSNESGNLVIDPNESINLLFILGRTLETLRARETDPNPVFEMLLEAVLKDGASQAPNLYVYNNLGGRNGYFRAPFVDMVDWGLAAGRCDEILRRIDAQRERLFGKDKARVAPEVLQSLDTGGVKKNKHSYRERLQFNAIELHLALKTGNRSRADEIVQIFRDAVLAKKNPDAAKLALVAIVPALPESPIDVVWETDTYENAGNREADGLNELIDASLSLCDAGSFRHYAYHVTRTRIGALFNAGELQRAVRWANLHREIATKMNSSQRMDGFRFTLDERLEREALRAIAADDPGGAVAVLRYFVAEPKDSFRYRDLEPLLAALEPKLAALDATKRAELLDGLDLKTVRRSPQTPKNPDAGKPKSSDISGLPPLPNGTIAYENDFESEVGEAWTLGVPVQKLPRLEKGPDGHVRKMSLLPVHEPGEAVADPDSLVYRPLLRRELDPKQRRTYLGPFHNEHVRFRKEGLPAHKYLRIRFDLFLLGGLDGLVGGERRFGMDAWRLDVLRNGNKQDVSGGIAPYRAIGTTFSNFHKDPNNQKQSFPDDYPPEFDRRPSWYDRVRSDRLWGDKLETGFYYGRHGAAEENTLGYEKDAVYAIDLVVPHEEAAIVLAFSSRFEDGPYEAGQLNIAFGESWGIDNFRVETIADPWDASDAELRTCWNALLAPDPVKAHAARWRMVAAGEKAARYVGDWCAMPENEGRARELCNPGNFIGFRIERLLQSLDTPTARTLRGKMFKDK